MAAIPESLNREIEALESVAVAFSGGADSTLLLAVSVAVLGPGHVLAVTADSPTLPRSELEESKALASEIGARQVLVSTEEMEHAGFVENSPDRCYHCKHELFARMRDIAGREGYRHLVYGATLDDTGDYRPGMRAAEEAGAIAPLLLAGLSKDDVRALSKAMGLRTWDKPSMACLSSRFPYGTPITTEGLSRVEQAEAYLRQDLGIRQLRVRDQGAVARIEVDPADMVSLVQEPTRGEVVARLKTLGYTYVTINLEGFRSGSLNDVLAGGATE